MKNGLEGWFRPEDAPAVRADLIRDLWEEIRTLKTERRFVFWEGFLYGMLFFAVLICAIVATERWWTG